MHGETVKHLFYFMILLKRETTDTKGVLHNMVLYNSLSSPNSKGRWNRGET